MGCKNAKPVEEPDIDTRNIPDSHPSYPPPYVPDSHVDDDVDKSRKEIAQRIANRPNGTDSTYSSLLKFLSEGAEKEVDHVTAIYLWMKVQDYDDPNLDLEGPSNTPRGYMKMMKEGEGDMTTFFTILCRLSGIPCVILSGLGKDEEFTIGTPETEMYTRWNAVFVDEEWRLVHTEWAIEGSTDTNKNNTNAQGSDFFFLVEPGDFAMICHPENHRWQLLAQAISKRQYLNYPVLKQKFFELQMVVVDPKTAIVKTQNAKQTFEIAFPKKVGQTVKFRYYLTEYVPYTQREDEIEDKPKKKRMDSKLNRYVFMNRKPTKVIFEIVLPYPEKYMFEVSCMTEDNSEQVDNSRPEPAQQNGQLKNNTSGKRKRIKRSDFYMEPEEDEKKETENDADNEKEEENQKNEVEVGLCQYKIISEREAKPEDLEPLPDCPEIGWGPGPECREQGLVPLTHLDSYIYIKPGEEREVRFKMVGDLDIQCQLTHNFLPIYELVEQLVCQVECYTEGKEAVVKVRVPEEGQYALIVYSRKKGTKTFHEACFYLMKQQTKSRLPEKYRDKMLRTRLEHHITNHTSQEELKDALEVFQCYNVPDQGETKRANLKMKQYWEVKKELDLAIRGRNPNNLRKWLNKAKASPYKDDLMDDIRKGEATESNMTKLEGYLHPIAKLDHHAITEIHTYKHPPPVVHDVMKSTYVLLGEEKETLDSWPHIQYLVGQQGNKSLQRRVLSRHPDDVSMDDVREADRIIEPYNLQKCREVSSVLAAFYRWCQQFSNERKEKNMDEEERRNNENNNRDRETFREPGRDTPSPSHQGRDSQSPGNRDRDTDQDRRGSPVNTPRDGGSRASNDQDRHPFAVNNDPDRPQPRFQPLAPSPSKGNDVKPVSYAGFKPDDID